MYKINKTNKVMILSYIVCQIVDLILKPYKRTVPLSFIQEMVQIGIDTYEEIQSEKNLVRQTTLKTYAFMKIKNRLKEFYIANQNRESKIK